MKTALLDLFVSKKFLTALSASAIYLAGRFGFDLDPTALDRIYGAFLVYVGAQGIADHGKSAAQIKAATLGGDWGPVSKWTRDSSLAITATPERDRPEPTRVPGPGVGPVTALLVVLGLGTLALQPACATVRPVATVGANAFVDCEADHLRAGVAELVPLATQVVLAAISGDGRHVDTAPIRAAAQALRSDLGRCALATAIAILAMPTKPAPSAPMAAGLEVDGGELRAAFEVVRGEFGGSTFKTSAGVL